MNHQANNGRTVAEVLADTKQELKEFIGTRVAIFKTEIAEKLKMLKIAAPLAAAAILLFLTAYLLLTMALAGLVFAFLPDNAFRWCLAFLAVAVLWAIVGGITAYLAKREFQMNRLLPNKTIDVLKDDKVWIQSEVKSQL